MEKVLSFVKNFYLQIMEDEYTLVRSPIMDKTKWIEKFKYDVLRFSLDSIDLSLIEIGNAVNIQVNYTHTFLLTHFLSVFQVAPIRLCMCNMHTSSCNESLTLKVGQIQIRQLLRLYPGSWLEAGSVHIPELRMNAKFDCHPPTPININEQIEFLRRHDQHSQRLHFLYHPKSQQSTSTNLKRPSTFGLPSNPILLSCACLGGSPTYYTLIQGEQFFRSSFRLSEQPSFGRSLFRPDLHVIHSHPIFEHKYNWTNYQHSPIPNEQLNDEEIFYPFDFCNQQKQSNEQILSRSNSLRNQKRKSLVDQRLHKHSSSSIPLDMPGTTASSSSSLTASDDYLTPNDSSSRTSLNSIMESSSATIRQHQSSPIHTPFHLLTKPLDEQDDISITSSHSSSSTDSLTALEEILQREQTGNISTLLPQKVNRINNISLKQFSLSLGCHIINRI
jgi:hypothetical protein